mmetsp:Transcript_32404/g.78433  ORF Transcript_32404/g.78433 Transcript_32404/m.78433 type:complete len:110 (+) Transcript_32404:88-417(+)
MISTSARHGPDRPPHDQNMTPQDSQPTKTLLGGHRTLLPLRNQVFDRARWSDLTVDLLASIFLMMDDDDDENIVLIIKVRMFHLQNFTQSIGVLVAKVSMRSACLSRAY